MRIMNIRNFRTEFPTLEEPVIVISREKVIGTWTPIPPAESVVVAEMMDATVEYPIAKPVVDWNAPIVPKATFSSRPFRAVPKTGKAPRGK